MSTVFGIIAIWFGLLLILYGCLQFRKGSSTALLEIEILLSFILAAICLK